MDRFEAFTTFAAVARQRSFAGASRSLGISPPAVTRIIAALERHLGVALFHRSTRVVTLTEEGVVLLDRAQDILSQLRDAEHLVMGRRAEPRGELHITAPVMFGRLHVLPALSGLLSHHQGMTARVMLLDRNVRLAEEGIDVAVRIGPLEDSSLIAITLGFVRQMIVASPDYCARRGVPGDMAALAGHDIIAIEGSRSAERWIFGPNGKDQQDVTPRLTLNSIDAAIAAAVGGLGLANVLSYQVEDALRADKLQTILDDLAPPALPVSLLFAANRASLPMVRAFVDAMRDHARTTRWDRAEHPSPTH
jgi:DNA-binding transcriptional LysR family regulator